MGEQSDQSSQSALKSCVEAPHVVGSFQVKKQRYLIIALNDTSDTFLVLNQLPSIDLLDTSNSIQFHVDGQLCAVIPTQSFSMAEPSDLVAMLTERELQVVQLVAAGRPNKQIAKQLQISEWTVATHLRRIFAKLGVDSRAAMVYRCASIIDEIYQVLDDISQIS